MIQKNKFFFYIFLFIIFSTYSFDTQKKNFSIFPIKQIVIENNIAVDLTNLNTQLEFLRNTSLFFLEKKKILKVIDGYDFISNIQLRKKYPSTIKIFISEYTPVAIEVNAQTRYYLTKEGKKIKFIKLKPFENLPLIFGNSKNFKSFFNNLEKNNFRINTIKGFYYFDVGRWDIALKDGRIIKLPAKDYQKIIVKINSILNDSNFSKYEVFDYRIKNQLILQ